MPNQNFPCDYKILIEDFDFKFFFYEREERNK